MEQQSLAMTRSIGDFYMHTFGVTWKPEVISVDLAEQCAELENLTLILASDGIWDLWEYEDVFQAISAPPTAAGQSTDRAKAFFEKSVTRGAEMFEDTADNMTGARRRAGWSAHGDRSARPRSQAHGRIHRRHGRIHGRTAPFTAHGHHRTARPGAACRALRLVPSDTGRRAWHRS